MPASCDSSSRVRSFLGAARVAVLRPVSRSFGHRLRLRALHLDTLLRTAESAPARKGQAWLSVVEPALTDTELPLKPVASELTYIWRHF